MAHSTKADNRPSFQFYPDDWIAETTLRMCSLAARGLWIDLLCHMFRSKNRGCLEANGKQLTTREVALLVGRRQAEVKQALTELVNAGVCSRRDDGTIYNRRMVNEEELRRSKVQAGRKGGLSRARKQTASSFQAEAKQDGQAKRGPSTPSSSPFSSSTPTPPPRKNDSVLTAGDPDMAIWIKQYSDATGFMSNELTARDLGWIRQRFPDLDLSAAIAQYARLDMPVWDFKKKIIAQHEIAEREKRRGRKA